MKKLEKNEKFKSDIINMQKSLIDSDGYSTALT